MKLDLEKIWQIMNTLSGKELELSEQNCYVSLLGYRSGYCGEMSFDSFLDYYSFKIDGDNIIVFNDDGIPYENYTNSDFSSFPLSLLSFGENKLNEWMDNEIEMQLAKQEANKIAEKENIKQKIEFLTKQLNS